jgi:hypothetical protein
LSATIILGLYLAAAVLLRQSTPPNAGWIAADDAEVWLAEELALIDDTAAAAEKSEAA